ncbi:MAG: hypothetical protein JNM27_00020 [Leptospirales bacterium]|nr:hypothetical protein [Leptospirales bacterium]
MDRELVSASGSAADIFPDFQVVLVHLSETDIGILQSFRAVRSHLDHRPGPDLGILFSVLTV